MADKQAAPSTAVPDPKVDVFEDDDEFEEFENEGQSTAQHGCYHLGVNVRMKTNETNNFQPSIWQLRNCNEFVNKKIYTRK